MFVPLAPGSVNVPEKYANTPDTRLHLSISPTLLRSYCSAVRRDERRRGVTTFHARNNPKCSGLPCGSQVQSPTFWEHLQTLKVTREHLTKGISREDTYYINEHAYINR